MAGINIQDKINTIRMNNGFKPSFNPTSVPSSGGGNISFQTNRGGVEDLSSSSLNRIFNVRNTLNANTLAQGNYNTPDVFAGIPKGARNQSKGLSKYDDPNKEENWFQKLFNPIQDRLGDALNQGIENESSATKWYDELIKSNPGQEAKLVEWVGRGIYNNDWTLDGEIPNIVDPESGQTVSMADYVNRNPAFRTTLNLIYKKRNNQEINPSFDILEPTIQAAMGSPIAGTARSVLELTGQKDTDLYRSLDSAQARDIDKGLGQFIDPLTLSLSRRSPFYRSFRDPETDAGKITGGVSQAAGTLIGMGAIAPTMAPAGTKVAELAGRSPIAAQFLSRIAPGATNAFIIGSLQDPGGEGVGGFLDPVSRIKQGATGAITYAGATAVGGVTGNLLQKSNLPTWLVRGGQGIAGGSFDVARSYAMGERDPAKLATGFGLGFAFGAKTGQEDIDALYGRGPRDVIAQIKEDMGARTLEDIEEISGGWQNKGDRLKFDTALYNADADMIKSMLDKVPEAYKLRFADDINRIIGSEDAVTLYRGDDSPESPGRFLTNDPELAREYGDTTEYSVSRSKILDTTTPEGRQYIIDNFGESTLKQLETTGGRLPDGSNPNTVKLLEQMSERVAQDFDLIKTREYFEGDGMPESYFSTKLISKEFGEMSPFTKSQAESPSVKKFLEEHPEMKPGVEGEVKEMEWGKWDKFKQEVQNRAAAIEGLGTDAKNAVRKLYGAPGQAKARIIEDLQPIFRENNITVDELKDFEVYSAAKRNVNLASKGQKGATEIMYPKDGVFGKEEVVKVPDSVPDNPKFDKAFQQIQDYNKTILDYVYQGGLLSDGEYQALTEYGDYVPFQRYLEDQAKTTFTNTSQIGSVSSQDLIKKYVGSDKPILSPIESIIKNTVAAEQLVNRNNVAKITVDSLGGLVEKVPNTKGLDSTQYISVFENGEKVYYKAPEPIVEAAKNLNSEQMSTLTKVLAAPATVLRQGATSSNIDFMLPNIFRDQFNAAINSEYGYRPFADYASGFKSLLTKDQAYLDYLKSGAEINFGLNAKEMVKAITPKGEESGFVSRIKEWANPIKDLQKIAEYSEVPTRIGLYKRAIASGATPDQAMFESRSSTADFNVRGAKMQNISAITPFLNARVQGFDTMVQTFKRNPQKGLANVALYAVIPTIVTSAWLDSTPVSDQISDYDKDKYWIIPLRGSESSNPDDFFKIAKPQIAYMANPFRKALEMQRQGVEVEPLNMIADILDEASPISVIQSDTKTGQIRFDPSDVVPLAYKPPLEVLTNYDFYRQRPILSEAQKAKPGAFQKSSRTSPFFSDLGMATGQSPAYMQQLTYGYTGGFGKTLTDFLGKTLGSEERYPKQERPGSPSTVETPVVNRFFGLDLFTPGEQLDAWNYQMSQLRKQIDNIRRDRNMSRSQKQTYVKELSAQIKQLQANKP